VKKLSKKTVIYDRPLVYRPDIAGNPQILHVDKSLLIVSKPSGLLSVPGKADGHKICLESVIKRDYPDARIVHRLDLATSGVMVMARTAAAHRHLGLQFERRHVEKSYLARVWGEVPAASGHIDMPMRAYRAVGRLQLHAESLSLYHPDGGERMTFEAECEF